MVKYSVLQSLKTKCEMFLVTEFLISYSTKHSNILISSMKLLIDSHKMTISQPDKNLVHIGLIPFFDIKNMIKGTQMIKIYEHH